MNCIKSNLTYKDCLTEALKYYSIKEFYAMARPFYNKCYKNGWINKVTKHIRIREFKHNTWSKSLVIKEANKYKTMRDFRKYSCSAYNYAKANDLLNKLKFNPKAKQKVPQFSQKIRIITKEVCQQAALKNETKTQFCMNDNSCYQYAVRHKIMDEICSHMIKKGVNKIPINRLSNEKLLEESINKYRNLKSWSVFKNTYLYKRLQEEKLLPSFKEKLGKKDNQYQEKELVDKLYIKLISYAKFKVKKEYRLPKRDGINGRIDLFVKLENGESFGIEYKSGKAAWNARDLSKQITKYKRCLRDRKGLLGFFLFLTMGNTGSAKKLF